VTEEVDADHGPAGILEQWHERGLLPGEPVRATPAVDEKDGWLRHGRRR
jgi:hypothetical protein